MGNTKEDRKAFTAWFEWKPRGRYLPRIRFAAVQEKLSLKAQPGLPCQLPCNHPRGNFLIFPVFLHRQQWTHCFDALGFQFQRLGKPVDGVPLRPWRDPDFVLGDVP